MNEPVLLQDNNTPVKKANKFIRTFCILGIVFYGIMMVIGVILSFYGFILGLLGGIFLNIIRPDSFNFDPKYLILLPLLNLALFFALSLVGLIMLLTNRFRGYMIFTITQAVGVLLIVYFMYLHPAIFVFGFLFILLVTFFTGMFSTHIRKYR